MGGRVPVEMLATMEHWWPTLGVDAKWTVRRALRVMCEVLGLDFFMTIWMVLLNVVSLVVTVILGIISIVIALMAFLRPRIPLEPIPDCLRRLKR